MKAVLIISLMWSTLSLSIPTSAAAALNGLQTAAAACLQQASQGGDPMVRDQARTACLRRYARALGFQGCLRIVKGFEYSENAEEMSSYCLFEAAPLKVSHCVTTAQIMESGFNRDDLIWTCLKRLNLTISRSECQTLTGLMTFSHHKKRAASYCSEEIGSVR